MNGVLFWDFGPLPKTLILKNLKFELESMFYIFLGRGNLINESISFLILALTVEPEWKSCSTFLQG